MTAFHLRKRGYELRGLDDTDLKQVPVLAEAGDAYAPKDRVPYEVWNRLMGEPKPGQE
jgi:hypothetical protein